MPSCVRIHFYPNGPTLFVEQNTPLKDILFEHGVEFPCGGLGFCRACRIKVRKGYIPITPEQEQHLTREQLEDGWRLACLSHATQDITLELAQWHTPVLVDDTPFEFTPRTGYGIAVDIGTTTLAAQLIDLSDATVLGVTTALNPQAQHGSDIMSRIHYAVAEGGQDDLAQLIRGKIGGMVMELLMQYPPAVEGPLRIHLCGNTVMHHLFCNLSLEPLAYYPFQSPHEGVYEFSSQVLDWPVEASVRFLPCLGGFVGSDLLAGLLSTRLHERGELTALVDLGTNGEILIGNRDRILCASTAAGPAFEGGRITAGMRASTGAIHEAQVVENRLVCHTLGGSPARGICGSGLVSTTAACLNLGWIEASGRLGNGGSAIPLQNGITLAQRDIRQLQLAKGAIAAGIRILLNELGASAADLECLYLAGAFGNYINIDNARRIGLLSLSPDRIHAAGNTALLGTKISLFQEGDGFYADIRNKTRHVSLSEDPLFQDWYVEEMRFPSE